MTIKSSRRRFIESSIRAAGLSMFVPAVEALGISATAANYLSGPKPLSSQDKKVRELLARMTLEEKVGQMTQAEQNAIKEGDIENFFLGSLLNGGSSDPMEPGASGADVGIVVIGETPYAEGRGDREDLTLSAADITVVRNMRQSGIPVIIVLLSGRPMIINDVLGQCDSFVAAWLPGSEGQGVSDVLFGDYRPTGKLSFSWPRSMAQVPINVGDSDYDPLFKYGFGLTF